MTTSTADPAQPTVSTVVVAADGSVTVTQVSNATTVTYPGVVPAFSPIDLSPALWLDASDETTITESGGAVSQWDDKSGNGYNVVQGTSANQPTSGTRTLNGLNVLDFTDDRLTNGSFSASDTGVIFVVAQSDANPGPNPFLLSSDGPGIAISYANTTEYRIYQGSNVIGGTNNQEPCIWRVTFDATDTLHINGSQVLSGSAGTTSWNKIHVGNYSNNAVPWNGAIAEIIHVDGTLTAQQIATTEAYLTEKWIPVPIQVGAAAWYDASDETTITESGGAVSQWDDKSGNGYDLTQGTGSFQPKTGTATMNGLNVIEYDGANTQYLSNASMPWNGVSLTVFAVYEINASDTEYAVSGAASSNSVLYSAALGSATAAQGPSFSSTSLYVDGVEFTGTTGGDVYTTVGNSPVLVRATGTSTNFDGIDVGYRTAGFQFGSGTKVAEMVVVETPTADQISQLETYLADKWGITL